MKQIDEAWSEREKIDKNPFHLTTSQLESKWAIDTMWNLMDVTTNFQEHH